MPRLRHLLALVALALLAAPGLADADLGKLDPRARVALAQLRQQVPLARMMETAAAVSPAGNLDVFVLGDVTAGELETAGAIVRTALPGIFTAYIPESAVEAVAGIPGVRRIEGAALCEPELDLSVPTTNAHANRTGGPAFTGMNGAGVLVGDIDSGVYYPHDDFKNAGGSTRIVNIWDQTDAIGPNPSGYAYGSEWTSADIDALVARQVDTSGHGTHVLGIAGGDGSGTGGAVPAFTYVGMAPMSDLAMVKTTFFTSAILDGVAYVFGRATALGKNAVVNLSLGSHFGPHDGSSAFESGLSALTGPGRIIVKSAGNERGQARHAEVFAAGAGTNTTMSITGSAVGRAVAIDGYYNSTEILNVRITTPNGTVIGPIALGGANAGYPGQGTANGNVYLENGLALTANNDRQVYIEINVASGQNMNGTWTFTFIPVTLGAANGEVDLWRFFNSTGTTANFVLGNQSSEELVSEPGNAHELITTASWTSKQNWIACSGVLSSFTGTPLPGNISNFSSPGPTRDGRQKPDIAAPGQAIGSANTFDIGQSCPVGAAVQLPDGLMHTINQGTSMAAPHTTGAAALIMQKYGAVTPTFIKNFLNARAIVDGFTGAVPNRDWGNGKLFLGDMLDPSATVTVPNGGEVFNIGMPYNITWTASDNVGVSSVDIELSRSGAGGPWETVALGVANSGTYSWNVTGLATTTARVRVTATDAAGNIGSDIGDADFTIQDFATPALLSMFETRSLDDGVEVRWQFGDPNMFPAVIVERGMAANGEFESVAAEVRSELGQQIALDRSAEAGVTYYYRLIATSRDGQRMTFGPLSGSVGASVADFAIQAIVPNPSKGAARVDFALPRQTSIRLTVIDVQGREVAKLAEGSFRAGRYQATWSGEHNGRAAAAGLYFVRYEAEGRQFVKRLAITR